MDNVQSQSRARSLSRSRPTTPLRPPSRSTSYHNSLSQHDPTSAATALDTLEPRFAELADSMADLEANFMHLQLMHESLARFGESFAAFLYGLNVRAFCVDFPEAPVRESFERWKGKVASSTVGDSAELREGDTTFMTNDTSIIDQGSTTISSKSATTPKRAPTPVTPRTTKSTRTTATTGRGTGAPGRGGAGARGGARGGIRGSGLARARGRGPR